MNDCKQCDTEGLVSNCCNAIVHFMAVGAAKCSKCKKFAKLKPCDYCKEENSVQFLNNNKQQVNNRPLHVAVLNQLLPHTMPQPMTKYQKILILILLISYILLFLSTYLLMYK